MSRAGDMEEKVPARERESSKTSKETDGWKFGPLRALHRQCETAITAISADNSTWSWSFNQL